MKRVVVKVSGKLLSMPEKDYLFRLKDSILDAHRRGHSIVVVTGGGYVAREYINVARALNVPESLLDVIGIEASRLNALLLASILYPHSILPIPRSLEEVLQHYSKDVIPVVGGFQPGQSTNAVASVIADAIRADLIVNMLSDVDGVYSAPPGKRGAVKLRKLTYDEMESIIARYSQNAGGYSLFDRVALEMAKRGRIPVVFIDGRNPEVLLSVIEKPGEIGSLMGL